MTGLPTQGSVGSGQQGPNDSSSEFNKICFVIRQMIAQLDTMKLVQVQAVHGGGGTIAAAGTVDVLPLVNQIDGSGVSTPLGKVYGIPWWRLQGGNGAVICDPAVDDIGYVVCADRDISNVKATQQQSNPGSFRKFNIADGIYTGGCLNGAPTQYVVFTAQGIKIVDLNGNMISMTSSGFTVTTAPGGDFVVNGISVTKHTHAVTAAPGETGIPVG
jgi:hypothetical protein